MAGTKVITVQRKLHSEVGASGMYRWSVCAGSRRMSRGIKAPASRYAAEGTAAHEVAAWALNNPTLSPETQLGKSITADGYTFEVDAEMVNGALLWRDTIEAFYEYGDELYVEEEFHLAEIHEDLWGTADGAIWKPVKRLLIVGDYKYGAGIPVEAQGNLQLMYYALGALLKLRKPADRVKVLIVQPRHPHSEGPVREWEFDAQELLAFSERLRTSVLATEAPDAPLVPGDHCQFCPASAVCPALRDKVQKAAVAEFSPAQVADPEQLASALVLADQAEAWAKSVREFAYQEALHGRAPPGFKLVQKQARRKWRNEGDTIEFLSMLGIEDIYEPKELKSPAQVEKLLGKKTKIDSLTVKESSGYVLVSNADRREPVNIGPEHDFGIIEGEFTVEE